jgi:hypothetical protein
MHRQCSVKGWVQWAAQDVRWITPRPPVALPQWGCAEKPGGWPITVV